MFVLSEFVCLNELRLQQNFLFFPGLNFIPSIYFLNHINSHREGSWDLCVLRNTMRTH